jgi:hypothetical protein
MLVEDTIGKKVEDVRQFEVLHLRLSTHFQFLYLDYCHTARMPPYSILDVVAVHSQYTLHQLASIFLLLTATRSSSFNP